MLARVARARTCEEVVLTVPLFRFAPNPLAQNENHRNICRNICRNAIILRSDP